MSKLQMEKIEELTIYVVELSKSIELLKKQNNELQKQVNILNKK